MTVTPRLSLSQRLGLTALTLAMALLSGCAGRGPAKPDETRVKQFAGRGYQPDQRYEARTTDLTLNAGRPLDATLALPQGQGTFPLVVYLPAMGEGRRAGAAWSDAWARSGYAVLTLQPLGEDAGAWSSPSARAGDFLSLAHARYSAQAMGARLDTLGLALADLARRQGHPGPDDAPLARIDLTRVAIAGYDLGAYTAMAVAGEEVRGVATPPALPVQVAAVVALSPYADFSGVALSQRYTRIKGPVLSVTGNNDGDATGLVNTASLRRAPYEYMPAGGKYLLTLADLPHSGFAGGTGRQDAGAQGERRPSEPAAAPEVGDDGRSQGGGSSSGRSRRKGGGQGDSGSRAGGRSGAQGGMSATNQAVDVAAIQGLTTAFLDAYVKDDSIAREWLEKDAARWVKDIAELRRK